MQLNRVSQYAAIELGETYGSDLNDVSTYVYDFNDGKSKQVLGSDTSNNSRNYSTTPYQQNVLLRTTPQPYFPNTYHNSRELNVLVPGNLPIVQFTKLRLHLAAGWTYPSTVAAMWFRVYVKLNDKEVTLCSIIDQYYATRLMPNTRNYVLENQVFTQHIEVDILDVNFLLNSRQYRNPAFKEIIDQFTGGQPVEYLSDLMVDFGFISNDQMTSFVENGVSFQRFTGIDDFRSQVIQQATDDDDLFSMITLRKENPAYLEFALVHNKVSLQSYFDRFSVPGEEIDLWHQITIAFYSSTDVLLATDTVELRDFARQFNPVFYIPVEYYAADHMLISCKSIATNSSSGQTWIRLSELAVLVTDLKPNPFVFQLEQMVVENKVEKIQQVFNRSSDLPEVIEVLKPVYYQINNPEQPDITLTPYDAAHSFTISPQVVASKNITLHIGGRSYNETSRSGTGVTFTIPSLEYYRKDTEYYITDQHNQQLYRGKITRYGE